MKLLISLVFAAAVLVAIPARAASEYILVWTNYNPFYTQTVAGPFDSLQECMAVESQNSYQPGGSYSCKMIYVPGQR